MVARTENLFRRALNAGSPSLGFAPSGAAQVFTQGFLNASMLQLAICAPPRQAASVRRYTEIYITEPGERAVRARQSEAQPAS